MERGPFTFLPVLRFGGAIELLPIALTSLKGNPHDNHQSRHRRKPDEHEFADMPYAARLLLLHCTSKCAFKRRPCDQRGSTE